MATGEDSPRFSHPFSTGPSWNPALRPDHESPQKPTFNPLEVEASQDSDDDLPTNDSLHAHDHTPSWASKSHLLGPEPASDDDFFDRYGAPEDIRATAPQVLHQDVHRAWEAIEEEPTAPIPDTVGGISDSQDQDAPATEPFAINSAPEDTRSTTYEHQGEITAQEEAIQEDPEAPLVADLDGTAGDWGGADDWELGGLGQGAHNTNGEPDFVKDAEATVLEIATSTPQQPDVSSAVFSMDESEATQRNVQLATDLSKSTSQATTTASARGHKPMVHDSAAIGAPEAQGIDWGSSEDAGFEIGDGSSSYPENVSGNVAGSGMAAVSSSAPNGGEAKAEDLSAMWSAVLEEDTLLPESDAAAFGFDDDEGFLDDTPAQVTTKPGFEDSVQSSATYNAGHEQARETSARYTPASAQQHSSPTTSPNPYLPQGPQFTNVSSQNRPGNQSRTAAASPYQSFYQQHPPQRPAPPVSAQSFVDKSKGGYHSPYDLPDDLAVTRRRPLHHHSTTSPTIPQTQMPPPRSSSIKSMSALPLSKPQPPPSPYTAKNFTPPSSSHSVQAPNGTFQKPSTVQSDSKSSRASSGDFFADLPVTQRPARHATPSGRYTPQPGAPTPPLHNGPITNRLVSSMSQEALPSVQPLATQLQAPERIPPYADESHTLTHPAATAPVPPLSTRYSPALPASGAGSKMPYSSPAPPASGASRYSPAPPPKPTGPIAQRHHSMDSALAHQRLPSQTYAPRTSSPLAFHSAPQQQQTVATPWPENEGGAVYPPESTVQSRSSLERVTSMASQSALETVAENEPYGAASPNRPDGPHHGIVPGIARTSTPPLASRSGPSSTVSSPRKRSSYTPSAYQPNAPSADPSFAPPRRSQTSSPGGSLKNPKLVMTKLDRPASAHGHISPTKPGSLPVMMIAPNQLPRHQEMNLIPPEDSRAHDPLERWKGAPIFRWGIGASVVTSFPKYVPRYGSGHSGPQMKPSQDEVKTRSINDICPHSDSFLRFPGPLKKGKKKEVLSWLRTHVELLENEHQSLSMNGELSAPAHKRSQERILLWRVTALLVEHDGTLEGNPSVEDAVRKIISPEASDSATTTGAFGATQRSPVNALPEALDPASVNELRNHLYLGEREKAVWDAVDRRLWAHALLIASTLQNKDIWKQVVQEFVRKEIRKLGDNTEALAALYQVFAGNWEESIDELVSVSARAGFQMVSTASGGGSQKDALAGLDRWRETMLLILNNRSPGDVQALVALGKLLSGYGRVEAAHVCFLFAKSAAVFGPADDAQSLFSLVGGALSTQGSDFGKDLETILLSEVYEFALTLGPIVVPPVPHLQAFKLYHAEVLAETGRRTEAQQYCDVIATNITSKSNRSPYHNRSLMQWVDEFNKRLSQAPVDSSSSWKPSMDKVSSSLWGRFNNFIAGEENDAASTGSGSAAPAEVGQFARLAGETPPLSRAVSNADMYGAYQPNGSTVPLAAPTNSRYAPSNTFAPRSSSEQHRPKYDPQSQSAYQPRTSLESTRSGYEPGFSFDSGGSYSPQRVPNLNNTYAPAMSTPAGLQASAVVSPQASELNVSSSPYSPSPYPPSLAEPAIASPPYLSTPPTEQQYPSPNGYQPSAPYIGLENREPSSAAETPDEPQANAYEPPVSSYEPPSYQPYQPDEKPWDAEQPSSPEEEKRPKPKSFMDDDDDDDDIAHRAAQLKGQQKPQVDREVDDAFRKAAEADAARANAQTEKKGWFGGWFKRDPNAPAGPIKAKLGEENSFVFDPELKKWVNKKAGASVATPVSATPPPPKVSAPPSRPASGMGQSPPAGPTMPSSTLTPAATGLTPPTSSGSGAPPMARSASSPMPPPGAASTGPPSRPPSRPATSMSNVSDIDDLLGPAAPRSRAGAKKGARKGRYVDVMANQK